MEPYAPCDTTCLRGQNAVPVCIENSGFFFFCALEFPRENASIVWYVVVSAYFLLLRSGRYLVLVFIFGRGGVCKQKTKKIAGQVGVCLVSRIEQNKNKKASFFFLVWIASVCSWPMGIFI